MFRMRGSFKRSLIFVIVLLLNKLDELYSRKRFWRIKIIFFCVFVSLLR